MQLLGNYQSTLSSSYYQQLVTLLQQAIQAGDFGGGQVFDQAALVALQKQAQNFSTLPQPSAGQVVTDESFNNPFTLLAAQFTALLNESNAFATQMAALLSVLGKDTALVDQLLAEADLQTWASTIPCGDRRHSYHVGFRSGLRSDRSPVLDRNLDRPCHERDLPQQSDVGFQSGDGASSRVDCYRVRVDLPTEHCHGAGQ